MIFRRRGRFDDLVARQLDLFSAEEADLLAETATAEDTWRYEADRESSEELYGDLQLLLDALGDRLLDMRETYAATLDESAAEAYRAAFGRSARKRFGRAAAILADD